MSSYWYGILILRWKSDFLNNKAPLQEGWSMLLGYNEPGKCHTLGVDASELTTKITMTPQSRVDVVLKMRLRGRLTIWSVADLSWKEVAKLRLSTPGIKLVSPAVASDMNWLKVSLLLIVPSQYLPKTDDLGVLLKLEQKRNAKLLGHSRLHDNFREL